MPSSLRVDEPSAVDVNVDLHAENGRNSISEKPAPAPIEIKETNTSKTVPDSVTFVDSFLGNETPYTLEMDSEAFVNTSKLYKYV